MTWFNKQSRLVQILLLLIPVVNWITELYVRWTTWLKKGGLIRLIVCILVTVPSGIVFGWIDLVWVLLFNGEKPGPMALVGGAVVIAAVTLWTVYGHLHPANAEVV